MLDNDSDSGHPHSPVILLPKESMNFKHLSCENLQKYFSQFKTYLLNIYSGLTPSYRENINIYMIIIVILNLPLNNLHTVKMIC